MKEVTWRMTKKRDVKKKHRDLGKERSGRSGKEKQTWGRGRLGESKMKELETEREIDQGNHKLIQ